MELLPSDQELLHEIWCGEHECEWDAMCAQVAVGMVREHPLMPFGPICRHHADTMQRGVIAYPRNSEE